MFKRNNNNNDTLQKLRDVQAEIRALKSATDQLHCPITDQLTAQKIVENLYRLMHGDINVEAFVSYYRVNLDYLEEFGTYLVNFSKYVKDRQKYEMQLSDLKGFEAAYKRKLGID